MLPVLPVDFPDANIILQKPGNVPDSDLFNDDVPAFFGVDGRFVVFILAYMPNKEDMDAIKAGRPIYLKVFADHMPSISLFTRDEDGDINE
jgi:hypothetical protein